MKLEVKAVIEEDEIYELLIQSIDVIGILIRLHDSNAKDQTEFAKFQRDELKYAIKVLTARRNKRYDKENEK